MEVMLRHVSTPWSPQLTCVRPPSCLVVAGIATPQLQPVRQFPTPRWPSAKGRASHKPVPHNQWYGSYNPLEQVQKGINEWLKNVELSSVEAGTNNFCLQSSSLAHLFSRHLYSCSLSIYKFLYGTFNGGITTHGFGGGEALGDKDTTRVAAKTSTIGCMDSRRSSIDRAPWHGTYKAGGVTCASHFGSRKDVAWWLRPKRERNLAKLAQLDVKRKNVWKTKTTLHYIPGITWLSILWYAMIYINGKLSVMTSSASYPSKITTLDGIWHTQTDLKSHVSRVWPQSARHDWLKNLKPGSGSFHVDNSYIILEEKDVPGIRNEEANFGTVA